MPSLDMNRKVGEKEKIRGKGRNKKGKGEGRVG